MHVLYVKIFVRFNAVLGLEVEPYALVSRQCASHDRALHAVYAAT